ncbi:MAG: RNA 2',3'-cyclic phosphodiesterase [Candidatus Limnocylindrales bacterium]
MDEGEEPASPGNGQGGTFDRRDGPTGRRPWEPDRRPGRRLFVAVPLPEAERAVVVALVERVRGSEPPQAGRRRGRPDVRWVRLDGLHLTLRFLGPTAEERLAAVREAVRETAAGVVPFRVRLSGGGAFPTPERPRAIWLGVVEGRDALAEAARRLDAAIEPLGWPPEERPFRAHLTLARSDGAPAASQAASRLQAAADDLDVAWTADRIVLFESHTGSGAARYEALDEVRLEGWPAAGD